MIRFAPQASGGGESRSEDPSRGCDHPGCEAGGAHRAPRSRDTLDSYYWFCLEHARSYNAAWNFFSGMKRSEIEDYLHADLTWHRPTWPLGGGRRINAAWKGDAMANPFGIFGAREAGGNGAAADGSVEVPEGEREALAILNLSLSASAGDIKARYKELVKRLHPDVNGGDRQAEDQLKVVIEAYRVLSGRRASIGDSR